MKRIYQTCCRREARIVELRDGRIFERFTKEQRIEGKTVGMVINYRDVTERKRAEAELMAAHKQLLAASHQAGMSEVATNVLHNVGNVLNSVNVSCSVISEMVRKSRVSTVAKTAELLRSHEADLAGFFSTDPAGKKLPGFLASLAGRLASERATMLDELRLLGKNIGHIKDIVAVQQNYAKNLGGVRETLPLEGLVEDAIRMNDGSLARHDIEIVREYENAPAISLEKHKVLQILVNLMRNAKHALADSDRDDKRLLVRIARAGGKVAVSIGDNGVGIDPENLTRIFAHGFTTRREGHGFGLHSGVLAARDMGGSLTATSAGRGMGATFTLELPIGDPEFSPQT
jgi:C4-dicarboxylate-specific signal transduction histidine kinase